MAPRLVYVCPQCPVLCKSQALVLKHMVEVHEGAGPSRGALDPAALKVRCRHCGKGFKRDGDYKQHLSKSECAKLQELWVQRQLDMNMRLSSEPPEAMDDGVDTEMAPVSDIELVNQDAPINMDVDPAGERAGDGQEDVAMSDAGGFLGAEDDGAADAQEDDKDSAWSDDEEETDSEAGMDWQSNPDAPPDDPHEHAPQNLFDEVELTDAEISELREVVDSHGNRTYIQDFPIPTVGSPIRSATNEELGDTTYPDVGELSDPECFEIAQLLMESGMSARHRNRYLRMKRLIKNMPWKNNRKMMIDIDKLPHGPDWNVQAFEVTGKLGSEIVELWMRDALEVVKQLLKNKEIGRFMRFKLVRKWKRPTGGERIRDEIYTADWMWEIQAEIALEDEQGTVIPIIISSDETKLTNFSGDKKAHPVYLTIGNIPKRLRRRISKHTNILLGYLPVPKLDVEPNLELRRVKRRTLFHACMRALLEPLKKACSGGVEVVCADGKVRRIYPVLASYIADFPEQCTVSCIKRTFCPMCTVRPDRRGDLGNAPLREHDTIVGAIHAHHTGGSAKFERLGLYPVTPFWKGYPYVRVGSLFTPDLLHQMHKGVIKDHLTKWISHILTKQTVDGRHKSMPEYHGMRHFKNGISTVSQWTGRELKEMAKVLLPIMADADARVVKAGRALLDFLYLSHSSSLSSSELKRMDTSLRIFHKLKSIFKTLKAVTTQDGFHGIPKIHMMQHYVYLIKQLGTPDGYNTETSERLHIDFAKMGYRASNKVNAWKQMARYIQRMEAIAMHDAYLKQKAEGGVGKLVIEQELLDEADAGEGWDEWYDEEDQLNEVERQEENDAIEKMADELDAFLTQGRVASKNTWVREEGPVDQGPFYHPEPELVLAKSPTTKGVSIATLDRTHNIPQFQTTLKRYVGKHFEIVDKNSEIVNKRAEEFIQASTQLDVWSRARLFHSPSPHKPSEGPHMEVLRAKEESIDQYQRVSRPARFDIALLRVNEQAHGIHQYRPVRVRLMFKLPPPFRQYHDQPLAFIELFNRPSKNPTHPTGLFPSTRSAFEGRILCTIVPLSSIRTTCHLTPKYGTFNENLLVPYTDALTFSPTCYINIFANTTTKPGSSHGSVARTLSIFSRPHSEFCFYLFDANPFSAGQPYLQTPPSVISCPTDLPVVLPPALIVSATTISPVSPVRRPHFVLPTTHALMPAGGNEEGTRAPEFAMDDEDAATELGSPPTDPASLDDGAVPPMALGTFTVGAPHTGEPWLYRGVMPASSELKQSANKVPPVPSITPTRNLTFFGHRNAPVADGSTRFATMCIPREEESPFLVGHRLGMSTHRPGSHSLSPAIRSWLMPARQRRSNELRESPSGRTNSTQRNKLYPGEEW